MELSESKTQKRQEITLIRNVLEMAAKEFNELEEKTGKVFMESGIEEVEILLHKKAAVIVDLGKDLAQYFSTNPGIAREINQFSSEADAYIKAKDFAGLCFLLDSKKPNGLNRLEKLINRLR